MENEITINLDHDNVTVVDLTDNFIRGVEDGAITFEENEEFNEACDNAQGQVFTGKYEVSYVVLKITHQDIE